MPSDSNRIRKALTGDEGHVVRTCGTCGGSGEIYAFHDYISYGLGPCDTCNGTWVIEDRERIAKAIWAGRDLFAANGAMSVYVSPLGTIKVDDLHFHQIWDNRHNQPWCEALEAFVLGEVCGTCGGVHSEYCSGACRGTGRIGGWREPADDFNTPEGMVVLKDMLREAKWNWCVEWLTDHYEAGVWGPGDEEEFYGESKHEEHEALVNAVIAAIGGRDSG